MHNITLTTFFWVWTIVLSVAISIRQCSALDDTRRFIASMMIILIIQLGVPSVVLGITKVSVSTMEWDMSFLVGRLIWLGVWVAMILTTRWAARGLHWQSRGNE